MFNLSSIPFVAVTPARDEERFLPGLIASMTAQTCKPQRWIIIDDGSTDRTGEILDSAAREHPWIAPVHLKGDRQRRPGGEAVIMQFLTPETWRDFDYIMRLDADLSFGADFAESLLREFSADAKLGIAGATLYEPVGGVWCEVPSPSFHTRGATKVYSTECFAAIGGLEAGLGWDTIDEVRAMMRGFCTRSFRHIRARHHRPQGSAGGNLRGFLSKGRTAHYVGYSPLFMLARTLRMSRENPLGALLMGAGYFANWTTRRPMVDDRQLIKFVRRQQHRRLLMLDSVWR